MKLISSFLCCILTAVLLIGCSFETDLNKQSAKDVSRINQNQSLIDLKQTIVDAIIDNDIEDTKKTNLIKSIVTVYVDEDNEKVVVGINKLSDEKIVEFKKEIADDERIEFFESKNAQGSSG